jgi:hypothetical protein
VADWPQPGDSLFNSGTDWETEALLNSFGDWFLSYASGYKAAADAVVERVEAKEESPDRVGNAVCFLYRHYVELMLKGLISVGTMLGSSKADYPKHHRIDELWRQCRPLLEKASPEGEKIDTDAVERCIKELASMDPSGEAFRFGEDKDGRPTIPRVTQISLTNMRDVMNRIAGFLEGSYDWMYELLQYQADIDAEFDADIGGES